jgi:hypothetical protein
VDPVHPGVDQDVASVGGLDQVADDGDGPPGAAVEPGRQHGALVHIAVAEVQDVQPHGPRFRQGHGKVVSDALVDMG